MLSTRVDIEGRPPSLVKTAPDAEKVAGSRTDIAHNEVASLSSGTLGDHTHRKLKSRHIQLIGMVYPVPVLITDLQT